MTHKELKSLFQDFWKETDDRIRLKNKTVSENLKFLSKKSKELNKEIPEELLVIIWVNQSVGMWVFEKYKEWLK